MRYEMKMPDLATTDSQIRVVRWYIEPGQKIERGAVLLEVETDKAAMEVESFVSGTLLEVVSQVDAEVSVGQVVAVLEVDEAARSEVVSETPATGATGGVPTPPAGTAPAPPRATGSAGGMFARNRAAAPPPPAAGGIRLSLAQRVAGQRLQESKRTIPHFYLRTSFNASAIVAHREASQPSKPAWDAYFVLAVAKALRKFERFRCRLDVERLTPIQSDAIGVAMDDNGELYVIGIADAAAKTVEQISLEIRAGAQRIRGGDQEMRKIRPALMTVSNLGVCDVEGFLPIINPPEAAILGIGKVKPTPTVQADNRIGIEPRCTLTLCVDHRVASGKYAGDFLGEIVKELESMR